VTIVAEKIDPSEQPKPDGALPLQAVLAIRSCGAMLGVPIPRDWPAGSDMMRLAMAAVPRLFGPMGDWVIVCGSSGRPAKSV
jgi:hypothetical protein